MSGNCLLLSCLLEGSERQLMEGLRVTRISLVASASGTRMCRAGKRKLCVRFFSYSLEAMVSFLAKDY